MDAWIPWLWRGARALLGHLLVSTTFVSCNTGGGDGPPFPGGRAGAITIGVTAAPVEFATRAVVRFAAVEVKPEIGDPIRLEIDPDRSIDLLALAPDARALLIDARTLPPGRYAWIRLIVRAQPNVQDESFVELVSGGRFPLVIPPDAEDGLRVTRSFEVRSGERIDFTFDLDLRSSIVAPPGTPANYLLRPALRLVNTLLAGSVFGTVAGSRVTADCAPFVYIYAGPDAVRVPPGSAPAAAPVIAALARFELLTGEYRYRAAFLEQGEYTAAFTCDGPPSAAPAAAPQFVAARDVVVRAGESTRADLGPLP